LNTGSPSARPPAGPTLMLDGPPVTLKLNFWGSPLGRVTLSMLMTPHLRFVNVQVTVSPGASPMLAVPEVCTVTPLMTPSPNDVVVPPDGSVQVRVSTSHATVGVGGTGCSVTVYAPGVRLGKVWVAKLVTVVRENAPRVPV